MKNEKGERIIICLIPSVSPKASLVAQSVKSLPVVLETWVQSLGQEDSMEKEMATPFQYSCLYNSMDRGAWWVTVHGVTKSNSQGREKVKVKVAQLCPTLWDPMGSLSLLQGIFLTQGLNPGLPHCRQMLYQLSHKGRPRILKWVASPFSSRSFQFRNWTRVSWISGRLFTNWAIKEALRKRKIRAILF